jgi:hypothetical protein
MIHAVKPSDSGILKLALLSKEIHSTYFPEDSMNTDYFTGYWKDQIESGNGAVWLTSPTDNIEDSVGGLGSVLSIDCYTGLLQSTVIFWRVIENRRGSWDNVRLVKRFHDWSKEKGATHLYFSTLFDKDGDKLKRFLDLMGLKPLEVIYSGRIT